VHPIERLRYVARASGVEQAALVRETAYALSAFDDDPAGLVAACRRIIDRHPTSGPLWWLCARVLTAPEPYREAWAAVEDVESDATGTELVHALVPDATVCVIGWPEITGEALPRRGDVEVLAVDALGEGTGLVRSLLRAGVDAVDVPTAGLGAAVLASDLVLLEAVAMGPDGMLAVSGSLAAAAVAQQAGIAVWAVAGVGRLLPGRMWGALIARHAQMDVDPWDAYEERVALSSLQKVCGPTGILPTQAALTRTDCPIAPELFGGGSAPGTYRG
jgi:hypothetical protein